MGRMSSGGFRSSAFKSSSFSSFKPSSPSFKPSTPKLDSAPAATKNITVNKVYKSGDVYHSGSSTDGLFTGMMLGHMMTDSHAPASAPVIINGGGATAPAPMAQTVVPSQPVEVIRPVEDEGLGFFGWCGVLLLLGVIGYSAKRFIFKG